MASDINSAIHLFQAALAPAFLLTGTGVMLNVISGRLANTIGRTREMYLTLKKDPKTTSHQEELAVMDKCCIFSYRAFLFCSFSALCTCTLITIIFTGHFFLGPEALIELISGLFVISTTCLTIAIYLLVHETILTKKLLFFMTKV